MDASVSRLFEAPDADYERRVRDSFARQPAMGLIGGELHSVKPGRVEIRLPFRNEITQQHGYVHGGVVGMIADNAGGFAAASLVPAGSSVLTVEFKLNLLAPAQGEYLLAIGEVLRPGRTLIVTCASVYGVEDGRRSLCAQMQQTIMVLAGKAERGAESAEL